MQTSTSNPTSTWQRCGGSIGFAAIVAAFALLATLALAASPAGAEQPPGYLALGDSVSVGVGASDPSTTGFVPLFARTVASVLSPGYSSAAPGAQATGAYLETDDLAVGGETSASLIAGGQLDAALAVLAQRNQNASPVDDVKVITLSVGGNDLTPLFATCPTEAPDTCLAEASAAITTYAGNLGYILGRLRAAAGPDARVVVMTYYNPLLNPACPMSAYAPLAAQIVNGLNAAITGVAAAVPNVEVADVAGAGLSAADLQADCRHPNDSGYRKIADAFGVAYVSS